MGMAPPGGRPELPPEERRSVRRELLLRPDEDELLARAAEAARTPRPVWVRRVLLEAARKVLEEARGRGDRPGSGH